jgi:hypothetical protein
LARRGRFIQLMKISSDKPLASNILVTLRRLGYSPHQGRSGDSFVKPMSGGSRYPQFHLYVQSTTPVAMTLHLDQKAPTYGDQASHGGEYEGPIVEAEAARIQASLG